MKYRENCCRIPAGPVTTALLPTTSGLLIAVMKMLIDAAGFSTATSASGPWSTRRICFVEERGWSGPVGFVDSGRLRSGSACASLSAGAAGDGAGAAAARAGVRDAAGGMAAAAAGRLAGAADGAGAATAAAVGARPTGAAILAA